jgi:glycosyltransferase involved in cell wall biosynthesis
LFLHSFVPDNPGTHANEHLAMNDRRLRVLAIASHPVQYSAPLFRLMAQHPHLDFQVAYCSLRGAEAGYDTEFGTTVKWDVPMLEGYSWTHVPNRLFGAETYLRICNPGLWPLIRKGRFDALLCYISYRSLSFWIAYFAAKLARTTFLFGTDTITLAARDARRWKTLFKRAVWPFLFRLADQVIVPSSGTRNLMRSLGIPEERVTLTPYCVDNQWWISRSKQIDRESVRHSWGAAPTDFVILFCAKLQHWKRPFDLLRAFARVNESHARLVFAGDGPLRPELESQARALGISPRVRFLGFVNQSQLPSVYRAADLLVLPSAHEPFGVVVNEAICCGCPVAASNCVGAAADLIAPVTPEFVFRCCDIDGLAAILSRAVRNPAGLREIAKRQFEHIRTWGPDQNVSTTVEAVQCAVFRLSHPNSSPAAGSPQADPVQHERSRFST